MTLSVLPFRVTVNTQKTNGDVHEGDSVTLRCNTENCTPTQGPFVWFKNGLLLPQATGQELRISSVSHQDFGNYSCGLNNSDRSTTNETLLDVRCKYTFNLRLIPERLELTSVTTAIETSLSFEGNFVISLLTQTMQCSLLYIYKQSFVLSTDSPKNVQITIFPSGEIEEGDSLTLNCMSDANPALTNYTWFKISDTNVSCVGYDSKHILRTVAQTDAGRYFCVATNDMGSQNSTVIELKVKGNSDLPIYSEFQTRI